MLSAALLAIKLRPMKVRDLMAALSQLDPDLTVVMPGAGVEFATPDRAVPDVAISCGDGEFQLCDYDDDGAMTVARLLGPGEHDDREERPKPPAH